MALSSATIFVSGLLMFAFAPFSIGQAPAPSPTMPPTSMAAPPLSTAAPPTMIPIPIMPPPMESSPPVAPPKIAPVKPPAAPPKMAHGKPPVKAVSPLAPTMGLSPVLLMGPTPGPFPPALPPLSAATLPGFSMDIIILALVGAVALLA